MLNYCDQITRINFLLRKWNKFIRVFWKQPSIKDSAKKELKEEVFTEIYELEPEFEVTSCEYAGILSLIFQYI